MKRPLICLNVWSVKKVGWTEKNWRPAQNHLKEISHLDLKCRSRCHHPPEGYKRLLVKYFPAADSFHPNSWYYNFSLIELLTKNNLCFYKKLYILIVLSRSRIWSFISSFFLPTLKPASLPFPIFRFRFLLLFPFLSWILDFYFLVFRTMKGVWWKFNFAKYILLPDR